MLINIAHRGASGEAPENSLTAFRRALEYQPDMIELDVFPCATGELVVLHDITLDRTTNGSGRIEETPYEVLKRLDAGDGHPVPLLSDVIKLVDRKVPLNIEIKGKGVARPAADVLRSFFERGWTPADFVISSFHHREMADFKQELPDVERGMLMGHYPLDFLPEARVLGAASINPSLELVSNELVQKAHINGLKVYVYTVNTEEDLQRMEELGVDGVFCNYPQRVKEHNFSVDK